MTTEPKAKRARAKREYWIEKPLVGAGDWQQSSGPHADLRAALADLKEASPGEFRVVAVCWRGAVKSESKTVTRLEAR